MTTINLVPFIDKIAKLSPEQRSKVLEYIESLSLQSQTPDPIKITEEPNISQIIKEGFTALEERQRERIAILESTIAAQTRMLEKLILAEGKNGGNE